MRPDFYAPPQTVITSKVVYQIARTRPRAFCFRTFKFDSRVALSLVVSQTFIVVVFLCLASHGEVLGDERLNEAVHLRSLRWEHFISVRSEARLRGHCSIVLTRQRTLHN